jgi:hypothetical protein
VVPAISLPTFQGFGRKPPELDFRNAVPRHQKADGGLGQEFVRVGSSLRVKVPRAQRRACENNAVNMR